MLDLCFGYYSRGRSDDLQKMHFEAISPTLVVAAAAARQKPSEIDAKIKPAKIFLYPDDEVMIVQCSSSMDHVFSKLITYCIYVDRNSKVFGFQIR